MKKTLKTIVLCCIAALCALCFAACSKPTEGASVTAERLIEANDRQKVVEEYGNLQITVAADEAIIGSNPKTITFSSDDYGLIMDYEASESDRYTYNTCIDGVRYVADKNGEELYYASIFTGDYNAFIGGICNIDADADVGTPEVKDGKIVLVTTKTYDYADFYLTIESTFYCNKDTLLIEKVTERTYSEGEEFAKGEKIYVYGSENAPRLKAYYLHKNAADKTDFVVVRAAGTDGESRTAYTIAGTSELSVENTGETEYALYADAACTEEVKEIAPYVNETAPVFYLAEKTVPTVKDLLEANDCRLVVNNYGSVHVSGKYNPGNDGKHVTTFERHVSKNDYGMVYDSEEITASGEVYESETVINGVRYRYVAEDEYFSREESLEFFIIAADDYDEYVGKSFLEYIFDESVKGKPAISDGKIVLKAFDELFSANLEFVFNAETLLLESCTFSSPYTYENFEFSYGADYPSPRNAYKMHAVADDKKEITIIRNGKTDEEQCDRYVVSPSSTMELLNAGKKKYALFENVSCTREIKDFNEFVVDNAYPTIYFGEEKTEAISFVYAYTQADYDEFYSLLSDFEAAALDKAVPLSNVRIAYDYAVNKKEYLKAQANIAYCKYAKDATVVSAWNDYIVAHEAYLNAENAYKATCKRLYEAGAEYNALLFKNWSRADIDALIGTDKDKAEKLTALKLENEELARTLDGLSQGETWNSEASRLYEKIASNNAETAKLNGYDDFYAYACKEVYKRDWNKEEITAYGEYVKKYVAPLFARTDRRLQELECKLPDETKNFVYDLLDGAMYADFEVNYVLSYFATLGGSLGEHFRALFDKNVAVFGDVLNGQDCAYTDYLEYYGEPYCFFGQGSYYQSNIAVIHEAGHYASLYNYKTGSLSVDLAETHSQGNEMLFVDFLKSYLSDDEYEYLVISVLRSSLRSIIFNTIINEFELAVYGSETAYTAEDYAEVIGNLCKEYDVEKYESIIFRYTLSVASSAPVYYISYGVSLVSSLDLFVRATDDYKAAQESYRVLQEDAAVAGGFKAALALAGIGSPFEESTYVGLLERLDFDGAEYAAAVEDAVFAEANEIRSLVTLTKSDGRVSWKGNKVLLLTFHKYPDSYVEGSSFATGDWYMWTVTDGEIIEWYENNANLIVDRSVALKRLLGMPLSSANGYISAVWVDVNDVIRPAYQPDPAKQLSAADLDGSALGEYKEWFDSNILSSYFSSWGKYPWTRLGYTYNWGADDAYGLSEFLVLKNSTIEVEFTKSTDEFFVWLSEQVKAEETATAA